jgi:hypothetical protein
VLQNATQPGNKWIRRRGKIVQVDNRGACFYNHHVNSRTLK